MMRILTVRQPWAWAIIFGGKDVENRSRNIAGTYRGPVLVHAGLTAVDDTDPIWNADRFRTAVDAAPATARDSMKVRGAILGIVEMLESHHADECSGFGEDRGGCSQWAEAEGWHLTLAAPRALREPIVFRGGLGLRRVDESLADAARRAEVPA
ncbi:MAG: hypothetical protein K0S70_825 [Microbacterium sp.]|jgi:hypothetical protein|nr:hypothetical protein [Microbacterium sp.]